jgi:hypothetical protein
MAGVEGVSVCAGESVGAGVPASGALGTSLSRPKCHQRAFVSSPKPLVVRTTASIMPSTGRVLYRIDLIASDLELRRSQSDLSLPSGIIVATGAGTVPEILRCAQISWTDATDIAASVERQQGHLGPFRIVVWMGDLP